MRLKLLQRLRRIIDERETRRLSTTKLSLETENVDLVLVGLVEFGEFASEFVLGDVGAVGVEDVTVPSLLDPVFQLRSNSNGISVIGRRRRSLQLTQPFACGRGGGFE